MLISFVEVWGTYLQLEIWRKLTVHSQRIMFAMIFANSLGWSLLFAERAYSMLALPSLPFPSRGFLFTGVEFQS
jgi:hypothetical protein